MLFEGTPRDKLGATGVPILSQLLFGVYDNGTVEPKILLPDWGQVKSAVSRSESDSLIGPKTGGFNGKIEENERL